MEPRTTQKLDAGATAWPPIILNFSSAQFHVSSDWLFIFHRTSCLIERGRCVFMDSREVKGHQHTRYMTSIKSSRRTISQSSIQNKWISHTVINMYKDKNDHGNQNTETEKKRRWFNMWFCSLFVRYKSHMMLKSKKIKAGCEEEVSLEILRCLETRGRQIWHNELLNSPSSSSSPITLPLPSSHYEPCSALWLRIIRGLRHRGLWGHEVTMTSVCYLSFISSFYYKVTLLNVCEGSRQSLRWSRCLRGSQEVQTFTHSSSSSPSFQQKKLFGYL